MMSCEFLCSAWSETLWLQILWLRNLICITRLTGQVAHLIYVFSEASPPLTCLSLVRNAPRHLRFKMDPSGERDASAILSQKQNIIFNFLWFRALYVAQLSYRGGQKRCQNYLTHRRADFDPICQPSQRYSSSLFVKSADHRERAVSGRCTIVIGHEMLLASWLPRFKLIGACHYRFSSPVWGYVNTDYQHGLRWC